MSKDNNNNNLYPLYDSFSVKNIRTRARRGEEAGGKEGEAGGKITLPRMKISGNAIDTSGVDRG